MVTGKFQVQKVSQVAWSPTVRLIEMQAVYGGSPENDAYHKATPSGTITLQVDNPAAAEQFTLGADVRVMFDIEPKG